MFKLIRRAIVVIAIVVIGAVVWADLYLIRMIITLK